MDILNCIEEVVNMFGSGIQKNKIPGTIMSSAGRRTSKLIKNSSEAGMVFKDGFVDAKPAKSGEGFKKTEFDDLKHKTPDRIAPTYATVKQRSITSGESNQATRTNVSGKHGDGYISRIKSLLHSKTNNPRPKIGNT